MKILQMKLSVIFLIASVSAAISQTPIALDISCDKPVAEIQPTMWGIFFEDINFGADGGLYAEMVINRGFEFPEALMGWAKLSPSLAKGELTVRSVILGGVITLLFTAANVYLGLKVGLTFATSIPAAVISMALLRVVGNSNILENNIVQTIASAAGTLAAIIFVLPGLIMVGWWQGFPYWTTVAVCAIGGILGVMFSVPLRRALVTGSDLPYPEGVAAAEVLKVGTGSGGAEENRRGLMMIVWSSIASAGFAALAQTRLLVADAAKAFKVGAGGSAVSGSMSMLLIGVGHLVGLTVGIAIFVGLLISWVYLVPHYTALAGQPAGTEVGAWVNDVFRNKVRFNNRVKVKLKFGGGCRKKRRC